MKLNEHEALLTPKVLLVPYSEHHVLAYHDWMQDPELQTLTASEPLTLPEEYAMQRSWRTDADKLTFIVCAAPSPIANNPIKAITATKEDAPESMIGDVNLFLSPSDDDDELGEDNDESKEQRAPIAKSVIGEMEIMIASKTHRGCGLGKEVLNAFLWYVIQSLDDIMNEYQSGNAVGSEKMRMQYLRVKIDKDNARSIKLFESVGFKRVTEQPNYFGELELRWAIEESSFKDLRGRLGEGVQRLPFS
ncbi:unnamed protein product [Periconia digitata]|uniref:N-acetyltransferase domain-containing protein n=1 Tax=Periconia digitata TaxID=1303443 RepID=A0A9W4XS59_9PLEO|nr:unnamed protein product [Periconia digitata]